MRVFRSLTIFSSLITAAIAIACGSTASSPAAPSTDAGPTSSTDAGDVDSGVAADAAFPTVAPPDPPQVQNYGGAVLKSPKIVPIFFSKDDATTIASLTDFTSKIGATNFWSTIVTEYGVGPAVSSAPIALTAADDPPTTIDDSAIQAWLSAKLNSNDPAFPAPDANTVYALYYPSGITITLGGAPATDAGAPTDEDGGDEGGTDGGTADAGQRPPGGGVETSCNYFGGYHDSIVLDAAHSQMNVAYAVIPRCASFGDLNGIDAITGAASHEFIEAVTDPYPDYDPAYAAIDDEHFYWETFLGGGEIGDMCAQDPTSFTKFTELAYTVQRSWSNKAAKAGLDPCVPAKGTYFNTATNFQTEIPISIEGQTVNVKGVKIALNASATVELDLFSAEQVSGDWTVSAEDQAQLEGQPAQLAFAFDKTTGHNGDKINMTITVKAVSKRNRETFVITSSLGQRSTNWIGVVGN